MTYNANIGRDAIESKGWLATHKWLLLRRFSQLALLVLFLAGPVAGLWIVKGNLSSSLTMDVLPLSDPYVLLQSLAAGHILGLTALTGAAIVLVFYAIVGGRVYCSFVCPMNIVTDAARWLSKRFGLDKGWAPLREIRLWILGATLLTAFISGTIAWELINPVTILHRSLVFGFGYAWTLVLAIFLFDLLVSRRGWCGHLCPVGAFYGLVGALSLIRVSAKLREQCNDCMDCFAVCPEPHVIAPALRGADNETGPVIFSGDCTNCGRCIDVCAKDVFTFDLRFNNPTPLVSSDVDASSTPSSRKAA